MSGRRGFFAFALTLLVALVMASFAEARRRRGPSARAADAAPPRPVPAGARSRPCPGTRRCPWPTGPPGATPKDGGPSPVIFPPEQLTIRMNHRKHVKELGLTCTTCHDRVKTSTKSSDSLLPKPTRCDACHGSDHRDLSRVGTDGDDLMSQCGFCHVGYKSSDGNRVARMVRPKPNLKMNHALHVARNIGCPQCHGAVDEIELATRDHLPRMRGCFSCHQMPGPARVQGARRLRELPPGRSAEAR
ncbi:MAG: cytochrome c3 family protein [Polyangiaceae bacterium]